MPKIQETPSLILIDCIFKKNLTEKLYNCPKAKTQIDIFSELNRRFGMPLYIPLVSLLISFLLLSRREKKFQGLYKYFYFGLAFFALIMAEILVRYSGKDLVYTLIYYLVPISLIPLVYIELIRKFYYENLKV